jgi:hypothetical protein
VLPLAGFGEDAHTGSGHVVVKRQIVGEAASPHEFRGTIFQ